MSVAPRHTACLCEAASATGVTPVLSLIVTDLLHLGPVAAINPRAYEYTIVSYFLLPTALLRVPLLGSLVAFPGAALGAYCLGDILSRNPHLREAFDHL
jgi:hypothetical protein